SRSSSSLWRSLRQSSSQVPSTVTLRLLRRRLSNCSSESVSQAYFRRGIRASKNDDAVPGWCHETRQATTAEEGLRRQELAEASSTGLPAKAACRAYPCRCIAESALASRMIHYASSEVPVMAVR